MAILKDRNISIRDWFCNFTEIERQIEMQAYRQQQMYIEASKPEK